MIIEYPKLPEILSQVCSVFYALMIFGFLFGFVNNKILKKKIAKEMLNFYFDLKYFEKEKEFNPK